MNKEEENTAAYLVSVVCGSLGSWEQTGLLSGKSQRNRFFQLIDSTLLGVSEEGRMVVLFCF